MSFKSRLPVLGLGLLVLGLISWVVYLWSGPREPSYQGKTMTQWLQDLEPIIGSFNTLASPPTPGMGPGLNVNRFMGGGPEPETITRHLRAIEAFRQMGAAAVPPLVRTLGRPHPTLDRLWRYLETRSPIFARRIRLSRMEDMSRRTAVTQALAAVGPAARTAVPALLEWLKIPNDNYLIGLEMQLLRSEDGPALMALLDHPQARMPALDLLQQLRPQGVAPTPALVRLIDDPDEQIRRKAFLVLGGLGPSARPAVPRLLEAARGTNFRARYQALRALGAIGEGATEAVPALQEWSRHTNTFIRLASLDALKQIAPEATAKTGATNPPVATAHVRTPGSP